MNGLNQPQWDRFKRLPVRRIRSKLSVVLSRADLRRPGGRTDITGVGVGLEELAFLARDLQRLRCLQMTHGANDIAILGFR